MDLNLRPVADYGACVDSVSHYLQQKKYHFPFFVRGDDQLFSMINNLTVYTLNGVTTKVPRFERKEGPLQAILNSRSQLVINAAIFNFNRFKSAYLYAKQVLNDIISYRYGHSLGRHYGLKMYALSQTAFTSDLDGSNVRELGKKLANFWPKKDQCKEKFTNNRLKRIYPSNNLIKLINKILLILTINGHLVPFAKIFKKKIYRCNLEARISYTELISAS